jgi:pimeloyl-ACP methyl ester carboxylesterase
MKLAHDKGGDGPSLLVLLHGLGATREVWKPFVKAHHWRGTWLAPDLRGHGASPHKAPYDLGRYAEDVAELVAKGGKFESIVILGHSLGGATALTLASGRYGIMPARVFGLGIKVVWAADDVESMRKIASAPVRHFTSREDAIRRYLKVSGLQGLVQPDSPIAEAGVVSTAAGWRLAYDPRCAAVSPPPMTALIVAARAPIHLARGDLDPMNSLDQLAMFDPDARDLPGGHTVMVENPGVVWRWLEENLP